EAREQLPIATGFGPGRPAGPLGGEPPPRLDEPLVRLLLDCAEICRTSADFMIRGSELHPHICRACAAVCARCADECDARGEDPYLAACSEICRRAALSCAEMAGGAA